MESGLHGRCVLQLQRNVPGIDLTITDMIPVERGTSGRLTKLKIVGTKRTVTVGKELRSAKLFLNHIFTVPHLL